MTLLLCLLPKLPLRSGKVFRSIAMSHVFISYNHKDQDYAHALATALRADDYEVWIDSRSLPGAADWEREIQGAIDGAYVVMIIMTDAAEHSPWVKREKNEAEKRRKSILPLWRDGEVWFSLSDVQLATGTTTSGSGVSARPDSYCLIRRMWVTVVGVRTCAGLRAIRYNRGAHYPQQNSGTHG